VRSRVKGGERRRRRSFFGVRSSAYICGYEFKNKVIEKVRLWILRAKGTQEKVVEVC